MGKVEKTYHLVGASTGTFFDETTNLRQAKRFQLQLDGVVHERVEIYRVETRRELVKTNLYQY